MPQGESRVMLVFLRHGNSDPANESSDKRQGDLNRKLSVAGHKQAEGRRALMHSYSSVLTSPAERAGETALIVTGKNGWDLITVPELYMPEGPDGDILDQIYEEDPRRLPCEYFGHPKNQGASERFVQSAGAAIRKHLDSLEGVHTVGVFGHNVLLNFAGMGLLSPEQSDYRNQLEQMHLGEAGGFVMVLRNGAVVGIIPIASLC